MTDFIETAYASPRVPVLIASTFRVSSQSRPRCIDFAPSTLSRESERERKGGREKESVIDISVYERGNIFLSLLGGPL